MMLKTHYGMNGQNNYCLINIGLNFFAEALSLESVSKITQTAVIAVPDTFILEHRVSPIYIESIRKKYDALSIQIQAIDSLSHAIKRALDYYGKTLPLIGILIWNESELSLAVFQQHEKIFFHTEKISLESQNIIGVFLRFLNYFDAQNPDKNLEKFYFLDNNTLINRLTSVGLSLWNEKTSPNLLPSQYSNDYSNPSYFSEKMRVLKMLKHDFLKKLPKLLLALCSAIIITWVLLRGFVIIQDTRIHHLEKKNLAIKSKTESIERIKNQTILYKNTLTKLNTLATQQSSSVILTQLAKAMPVGVFLSSAGFDHSHLHIEGYAQTQNQIETLVENLKKNPDFFSIVLKPILADNTYPPYHFSFSISTEVKQEN